MLEREQTLMLPSRAKEVKDAPELTVRLATRELPTQKVPAGPSSRDVRA